MKQVYNENIFKPKKIIPYSAFHLDIKSNEIMKNFSNFFNSPNKNKLEADIEKIFINNRAQENILYGICVRSLFDLLLQVLNYEPGTEIIMTGINIPDMVKIVYFHGCKPVPVNVKIEDLSPQIEDIEKAITKNTKALLLSYYFGCNYDASDIYKLAKKHNLFIIEDAAEAFYDTTWNGNPLADISLFSFGTIKTMTAMGGAIGIIRNNQVLYRKMKHIYNTYPEVSNKFFANRLLKNLVVYFALNNKSGNFLVKDTFNKLQIDYRENCISLVRGFPVQDDTFLGTYRLKINGPMMAFLHYRFMNFDRQDIIDSTQKQLDAQDQLVKNGIICPGYKIRSRHFWLFPIQVPDVQICQRLLVAQGIDSYLGATQLKVIQPPTGNYQNTEETQKYFDQLIYLPIHKAVPKEVISQIVRETILIINYVKKQLENAKTAKL